MDDYLDTIIVDGGWHWPIITDFHCLQIVQDLPTIYGGTDVITCRLPWGTLSNKAAYELFHPLWPKVAWFSLLLGSLKIPRNNFILWLAILNRLSTLDKPWVQHLDDACVLCVGGQSETYSHLFFRCRFSHQCLMLIRRQVRLLWPNRGWDCDITWAAQKWRGKHVVNASYRSLLASLLYHIWQERNCRRFQNVERLASTIAYLVLEEVRQHIISAELPCNISSIALFRLWRIPWHETATY
ncbi:UNVERIFIED_CONTAM: hypothetical protein Slati_1778900 [Sesamum latifolium]|uniref:Reverse transcriptase zinc-binding domain-containing protein n=1 Tax=Sesamum latifolium TaxID=2727402 RepID=A0AAW2WYI0_9LAMI